MCMFTSNDDYTQISRHYADREFELSSILQRFSFILSLSLSLVFGWRVWWKKKTEKFPLVLSFNKSFFLLILFFIQYKSMSVRNGLSSIAPHIFRLRIQRRKKTHNKHLENTRKKSEEGIEKPETYVSSTDAPALFLSLSLIRALSLYRFHFFLLTIQHCSPCAVVTAFESANTVFSFRFVIERNERTIGY